jgi:hypothetical protein
MAYDDLTGGSIILYLFCNYFASYKLVYSDMTLCLFLFVVYSTMLSVAETI